MFEYKEMAKYYDLFYSNKSYQKEVDFLAKLIGNRKSILDVGCGTGIHMSNLENIGYNCDGIDLNNDMLDVARNKVKGNLFHGNLLDFNLNKKYDAIVSMFAVFNHLDNYEELENGIKNLYNHLNENGILIIDLHNGRSSGEKENTYDNYKRVMKWNFDIKNFKETTEIIYNIDGIEYTDKHVFKIYEINKLKEILNKLNIKYKLFENYTFNEASDNSKNIQIIIYK